MKKSTKKYLVELAKNTRGISAKQVEMLKQAIGIETPGADFTCGSCHNWHRVTDIRKAPSEDQKGYCRFKAPVPTQNEVEYNHSPITSRLFGCAEGWKKDPEDDDGEEGEA